MSAILSDNFRFYNLENFVNSVSSNNIYLFVGRSESWDNELAPSTPLDNNSYKSDVYDRMISLKKISSGDLIPVVNKNVWQSGFVYDMYRPDYTTGNTEGNSLYYPAKFSSTGNSNLNYGAKFYVMNEFYQVYKCLYNGQSPENPNGVPSTVEPTGVSASPIVTSDGYRWKYLYTIPTFYVINFINDYYIPVPYPNSGFPPEVAITNSAIQGAIDTLVVKNSGSGYTTATYTNVPILGDGVGGLATVVVSANGQIASASVTNPGSNYTFGRIDLVLSGIVSSTNDNAEIEVIIPPKYGHGYNPYLELGAYKLMIHTALSYNENEFPPNISYRQIGLISNPFIRNTKNVASALNISNLYTIQFSSSSGNFQAGETIRQNTTNATGKVVSWNSSTKTLKYYQNRFTGVYNNSLIEFSGNTNVVGLTSNASGTPSTYSDPGIEKDTGKILYIDNRIAVNRSENQTEDIKIVVEF